MKSCVPSAQELAMLLSANRISGEMDDEDYRILCNAIASLEMEGLIPSDFDRRLAIRYALNEITIDEAIAILDKRFKDTP